MKSKDEIREKLIDINVQIKNILKSIKFNEDLIEKINICGYLLEIKIAFEWVLGIDEIMNLNNKNASADTEAQIFDIRDYINK